FSSRRRHTRFSRDWSSDVCSSDLELETNQFVLMASPEKAICDKIITTSGITLRSRSQTLNFLIDDMRMEQNILANLNVNAIESWIEDAPKASSLQMLINTLRSL